MEAVVVRSGQDPVVVNLNIAGAENPPKSAGPIPSRHVIITT